MSRFRFYLGIVQRSCRAVVFPGASPARTNDRAKRDLATVVGRDTRYVIIL